MLFVISDSEIVSGPLSSADLSNKVPDQSRLRVAYQVFDIIYIYLCVYSCGHLTLLTDYFDRLLYSQGVHGAYSESAAEKAYPNCQAVPCEQFETAFEVKNKIIQSFTLEN